MITLTIVRNRCAFRRSRWLSATFLAALLIPAALSAASAQESSSPPAVNLPTITVSSTTIPTPIEQIASSVTVITAAEIERKQRRTVPDALMDVPGLNVVQTGGAGGQTSVFIRGTNSNHVKVFIDGIDVSDSSNPNRSFDFGQLLTGDIERIEVLRGPQSGLYGADAIGGVISITTKKGEGPPKATGMIEGGSFGTFNQNASVSGSQVQSSGANVNYMFNVQHYQSTNTPVTPERSLPPGRAAIDNSYNNMTYSSRLGADFSDKFSVNWVGRYTDATLHFTGDDFDPVTLTSFPSAFQSTQTVHQFFTRTEAVANLFDGRFMNYFGVNYTNNWNFNALPGDAGTVNKGDRTRFDWRGVAALAPGYTLVMGLENERETLQTDATNAANGNRAGYLELQSNIAERFFLVGNVRYDDNDAFGGHATYRIAPAFIVPVTNTKLKGSYGTGFKAPTLNQLFVSFPAFFFVANPELQPEKSTGYDVGFEQPIFNDRFRFGVTYFHNNITNLITTSQADPVTFISTNINVNEATTQGYETFAAWNVTDRFNVRADYTYTKAIDDATGLDLQRRPRNKTSVTASWLPIDPLQLTATVLSVSSWVDNFDRSNANLQPPRGYTIVNLAASYTINDQVKVFGRIDNLFNLQYEDPTGFLRPGFGVFGGVRVATQ